MQTRICVAIVMLVGVLIIAAGDHPADRAAVGPAALSVAQAEQPQRRPVETVRGRGVLESAETLEIQSPVRGEATVRRIVPEGSIVKKGDLLVELDDSSLRDELFKQQMAVARAQGALAQAEAAMFSLKQEGEGQVAVAELALKVAELDLSRFLGEGGEFEVQMKQVDGQIVVAEHKLEVAEIILDRTQAMAKQAMASQEDVGKARFAVVEATIALESARASKQLLAGHVREYRAAALGLAAVQAKTALARAKAQSEAARQKAEAEVRACRTAVKLEEDRLAAVREQIEGCRILAPRDGLVQFATRGTSRRAGSPALREGAIVRERQPILRMLDMSRLQVRLRMHESGIQRIRKGQPATVRFDALPDRDFRGTVISETPGPVTWLSPDVKDYPVLVLIEDPAPELRAGMTAEAEIDVSPPGRGRRGAL